MSQGVEFREGRNDLLITAKDGSSFNVNLDGSVTVLDVLDRMNAAATAANIMAGESLFRLGFSAELLHLACDVAVAMLLYALLRPVDRNIALLAAFMRLVSDVILATRDGDKFTWDTANSLADVKTRNLPIAAKLPADFGAIIAQWQKNVTLAQASLPK